jgi:hypothetical protein
MDCQGYSGVLRGNGCRRRVILRTMICTANFRIRKRSLDDILRRFQNSNTKMQKNQRKSAFGVHFCLKRLS